jgi:uncharacterized protein YprB with RNaseH-like and TPR domain
LRKDIFEVETPLLEQTFIHIQGIGQKTEQKLWKRGIRTWHHFLQTKEIIFSPARDEFVRQELDASIRHRKDLRFFSDRMSSGEMWRFFDAFKEKTVYLDIETSGGYQGIDEITVIGLFDGNDVRTFINGIDLDGFEIAIAQYDLVVTFNGTCFDLPLIRRWFQNISLPPAHIDLRFLLKKLGYTGGLKKIEKTLGLVRGAEIEGMDGYEAVMLWKAYQWGDKAALDTLIEYNTADIVNLKPLMEMGYREMKNRLTGF